MTLIETLAAIVLIGLTTLIATSLIAVYPATSERLAAHAELLRVVDATIETLRSGAVPLVSGELPPPVPIDRDLVLRLEVRELAPAGLVDVTAVALTTVRGEQLTVSLQTRLWRPP